MSKLIVFLAALILPYATLAQTPSIARPAITGISHVTLFSDDIPKLQHFYTSLLGWEQVPATGASSGVRFYANHLQYVELLAPAKKNLASHLDIVAFATSNAEALRKFLAANGIAVPKTVTVGKDGSRNFLMRDPDGNKIEFTQAGSHSPQRPTSGLSPLSTHIIHAGFMVRDRAAADHFYKDVLGFRLYWQGGQQDGHIDYVAMQVPDGTDFLEYMLNAPAAPSRAQLDSMDHFAPGVVSMAQVQTMMERRGWKSSPREHSQIGRDGKWHLNLSDPDGTRVEFTEFQPVQKPCCAPFTGSQLSPSTAW